MERDKVVRVGVAALACAAAMLAAGSCHAGGSSGQVVDKVPTKPSASSSTSSSASPSSALAGLSGQQIADRSLEAMKKLHSLTVKADLTDEDDGHIRATVTLGGRRACAMHATVPGMGTFTFIRTRKATVVKLSRKTMRAIVGREGAKLFAGKYLKVGDDPAFKDLDSMCRSRFFLGQLADGADGVTFTRKGTATVAGVPAVVLTAKSKDGSSRVYVASSGTPYLLKVAGKDKEDSGTVSFSDFDRADAVHLPPASKTIDISELHG